MSAVKLLLVCRHAPYGNSLARSTLDTALAAGAFDMAPTLLFMAEGVLQLLPEQDPTDVGTRNHRKVLDSLPLYDIDQLYVDGAALAEYGLTDMPLPEGAVVVDGDGMRKLLQAADHLLGF
ncbi:sulfurtransferase complex subunit TusC [Parahaliea maris]|uniref:Sulfurtransferase complex subunit TusC n=1 Tax=Parahaliea maris TaxID=2716870 RepID=A0A5C9A0V1_9GAMM|nr:sulfurtransferase complex subunit TusC [Parahaliea maris]TXS93041.1 sulfurtransferase complex subunit TusC [Parahaliea maris]